MSWPRDGKPRYMPDHWPSPEGGTAVAVVYDRARCWQPVWSRLTGGRATAAAAAAAADRLNRIAA